MCIWMVSHQDLDLDLDLIEFIPCMKITDIGGRMGSVFGGDRNTGEMEGNTR